MELDQLGGTVIGHEAEGVHTKAVHVAERPGNAMARHSPEESVHGAGLLAEEVPGRVVGRRRLGDLIVAPGLDGMDQIGEEDGILDEEDGNVVAHNI